MKIFLRFAHYLKPYWLHIILVLASTGLFVLFSASAYWLSASFLQTLFTGSVSNSAGPADSLNSLLKGWTLQLLQGPNQFVTLFRASLAIVLAFVGKNLFSYLQVFFVSYVEQGVIRDIRNQLFKHYLTLDLGFFHENKRGHLVSALLNDIETLNQALNKSFTKAVRDPFSALFVLVLLFAVSWKLTLASLIVVPAVGWTVLVLGKRIKQLAGGVQEALARVTGHFQETVSGIRVVKAFSGEDFERKRIQRLTRNNYSLALARERFRRMVIPVNEFIGVLIISAILYIGGEQILVNKSMDSEDFIRFLVLLFALLQPLLSLGNLTSNIRVAEAAGGRVFNMLDQQPNLKEADEAEPVVFNHSLLVKNLSFSYNSDSPKILNDINLELKKGEKIALVGKSGSGKSSLLNLIARFYDPDTGSICLDGKDIRNFAIADYRSLFGLVTQQVILFHDTVANNISYGTNGLSRDQIVEAAKSAYAHEFISGLPDGYDTIVGEMGSLFSGGQRQRISIARAFARNPQIILLDEATSSLDSESEQRISAALKQLVEGRTVITVTHRLSTILHLKRILIIENGMLVDSGNHADLIDRNSTYRQLALQQNLLKVTA